MQVLLNEQAVIFEVLNIVRLRTASAFQIPEDWVTVRLERDRHIIKKATYHPVVELALPSPDDPTSAPAYDRGVEAGLRVFSMSKEAIGEVLTSFITQARDEIAIRLEGLDA